MREHEEVRNNALSCDSLNEQLTKCRHRATKLEQDKEHWRLEYQLLQLRHCKVSSKLHVYILTEQDESVLSTNCIMI